MITNKIDFVMYFEVKGANPNGDPLNGNMPRVDYDGYGEISDVCIKRKIRNRLQDMGESIFVQSNDRLQDDAKSLEKRYGKYFNAKDEDENIYNGCCKKWIDVRSFGQVITFDKKSIGIRGPVSISLTKSITPVDIVSMQITRSTNGMEAKDGASKSSDTMGMKHYVEFGIYKVKGSINSFFADKTGFGDKDVELIKKSLITLFENDMSSARPEGSMAVKKLYWFKHANKTGNASSAKIHALVKERIIDEDVNPKIYEDFEIYLDEEELKKINGVEVTVLDDSSWI